MCKYCEEGKDKLLPLDYANTDFAVSLDEENEMSVSYDDCDYLNFKINYCPMCGRRLVESEED